MKTTTLNIYLATPGTGLTYFQTPSYITYTYTYSRLITYNSASIEIDIREREREQQYIANNTELCLYRLNREKTNNRTQQKIHTTLRNRVKGERKRERDETFYQREYENKKKKENREKESQNAENQTERI